MVLDEVPPNATAVGVPARIVSVNGVRVGSLDQIHVTDPVSQEICRLNYEVHRLQQAVASLANESPKEAELE